MNAPLWVVIVFGILVAVGCFIVAPFTSWDKQGDCVIYREKPSFAIHTTNPETYCKDQP